MSTTACGHLADIIVGALEDGESGAVRAAVEAHIDQCERCGRQRSVLMELAVGFDPEHRPAGLGLVARVMSEIRDEGIASTSAYDRLPPLWQVLGAGVLLVALSAVVLATGGGDTWHQQIVTGYLDEALHFLGGLSHAIQGLWDAVVPGRGLPILIGCAVIATILNVAFAINIIRRKKETVD
jgi:hypothetical protein